MNILEAYRKAEKGKSVKHPIAQAKMVGGELWWLDDEDHAWKRVNLTSRTINGWSVVDECEGGEEVWPWLNRYFTTPDDAHWTMGMVMNAPERWVAFRYEHEGQVIECRSLDVWWDPFQRTMICGGVLTQGARGRLHPLVPTAAIMATKGAGC